MQPCAFFRYVLSFVDERSEIKMLTADPEGTSALFSVVPFNKLQIRVAGYLSMARVKSFQRICRAQTTVFVEFRAFVIKCVQEYALDWVKYLQPTLGKCGEQLVANPPTFVAVKSPEGSFKIAFNKNFWFNLESAFMAFLTMMDILMFYDTGRIVSVSQAQCYGSYPKDSVFVSRKTFEGVDRVKPGFGWRGTGEDLYYVFSLAGYYHTQSVNLAKISQLFKDAKLTGKVLNLYYIYHTIYSMFTSPFLCNS